MRSRRFRPIARVALLGTACLAAAAFVGCMRVSNGTWYVQSAATPDGWPEPTPVGTVELKAYPEYRAASVTAAEVGGGMSPMFMELFRHIRDNDIAMTAPVEMEYDEAEAARMTSMAFLYRRLDQGRPGSDGVTRIDDVAPRRFASVGVRGDYTVDNYRRGLAKLEDWLRTTPRWRADGPPRYLGYNGPFVPAFARYGEVQVPVVETSLTAR